MMATEENKPKANGVECPLCGCPESTVAWTRRRTLRIKPYGQQEFKAIGAIVRARECAHCGYRFQSSEVVTE